MADDFKLLYFYIGRCITCFLYILRFDPRHPENNFDALREDPDEDLIRDDAHIAARGLVMATMFYRMKDAPSFMSPKTLQFIHDISEASAYAVLFLMTASFFVVMWRIFTDEYTAPLGDPEFLPRADDFQLIHRARH